MTFNEFAQLAGVVVAASWLGYSLESLQPIHPAVRRGLQVALMGATAVWVLHATRVLV